MRTAYLKHGYHSLSSCIYDSIFSFLFWWATTIYEGWELLPVFVVHWSQSLILDHGFIRTKRYFHGDQLLSFGFFSPYPWSILNAEVFYFWQALRLAFCFCWEPYHLDCFCTGYDRRLWCGSFRLASPGLPVVNGVFKVRHGPSLLSCESCRLVLISCYLAYLSGFFCCLDSPAFLW